MRYPFIIPSNWKRVLHAVFPKSSYIIKDVLLEDGLTLRYLSFTDSGAEAFKYLLEDNADPGIYYFTYCPDQQVAEQLAVYYKKKQDESAKRFFYSPGALKKKATKELLTFIIHKDWIKTNYNCSASAFAEYIGMLPVLFNIGDNPNLMKIDVLYRLKAIEEALQTEKVNLLKLRVNVLGLIENFFSAADFTIPNTTEVKKQSYAKEMQELSNRLSFYLKTNLPDLIIFAKEYNMSLSSLKRHFKNVHGKPIYEYYLEQKMILARNIIQNSNCSVAQTAYELGYEDPKSLIKSFKKVYGVSPGKLCA